MPNYHPDKELLTNRTSLVTGAGDGIGRVASVAFATHGATVVLLGRTIAKLEATYDAISRAPMNMITWSSRRPWKRNLAPSRDCCTTRPSFAC